MLVTRTDDRPDPHTMPQSAFAAKWEGFLTPDASVDDALFQIVGRGNFNASLTMSGNRVLSWVNGQLDKKAPIPTTPLTKGVKVPFVFTFAQHDATGSHPAFALVRDDSSMTYNSYHFVFG